MNTKFYLGTHIPGWLNKVDIPLFVSRRTLCKQKTWQPGTTRWALDSGGFSELSMHGSWNAVPPEQYVAEVRSWSKQIGGLDWAAIQDWMCEPVIRAKTGKSVLAHQLLTIRSLLYLRILAPEIPWAPVIQGWEKKDYLRHIELYADWGYDLRAEPIVGIGSVCRRQATDEIADIIGEVADQGIRLHGFGVKTKGLAKVAGLLASADSLAWSFAGRRDTPMRGHTHKNCANCMPYAMRWRDRLFTSCSNLE